MAKKQTFGDKALQAKASYRKMAKVIIAKPNAAGKYSYAESMVDQDRVQEYLKENKA